MRKSIFAVIAALLLCASAHGQANCVLNNLTTWTGTAFAKQSTQFAIGPFTLTPTATPPAGSGGPTIGLSENNLNGLPASPDQHGNEVSLIRQSENGFWEVYNGTTNTYTHQTAVQWSVNQAATFLWQINITNKTATVNITTPTGNCTTGCVLAPGYAFRSSAPATSLGFWNLDPAPVGLSACGVSLNMPNPIITTISPNAGPVGTLVSVTGSNFGTSQGNSTISFAGVAASNVGAWSATSITATVPNTAGSGNVLVSVNNLQSNGIPFTVTTTTNPAPPLITSVQSSVTIGLACGPTQAPPAQHSVILTWTASNSSGITAYNVYRSISPGAGYAKIGSSSSTVLSYSDIGVAAGATYYYVVTALAGANESVYSNQASATIP